jgi:2'-5' RNA ligase
MAPRTQETRRQLSLYVPSHAAAELEAVRQALDPVQSRLIPVHVTLCREDEMDSLSELELRDRLSNARPGPVTLQFGRPEVFSGHGILLNCIGGEGDFRLLRELILGTQAIRARKAHITLAHPRNPKSSGNSLANASCLPEVISITFPTLCLIEQERSEPWKLLRTFDLSR